MGLDHPLPPADRPGIRRLLDEAAQDVVTLSGTGEGELDPR
jgi:hypothetical protein